MKRIFTALALLLAALAAQAQSLTDPQVATLRTSILADGALAPKCLVPTGDAPYAIRDAYNLQASPSWVVWRTAVPTLEIGLVVNYVAVAAMTTANLDRVRIFYELNPSSFDPARSDIRTYLSDTFSGALGGQGQATRDALDAMYRRTATRVERLYTTGIGTTASPASLVVVGPLSITDVQRACPGG